MSPVRIPVIALVFAALPACSALGVDTVRRHGNDCTSSAALPTLDTLAGVPFAVVGIVGIPAGAANLSTGDELARGLSQIFLAAGITSAVVATGFFISAGYGFSQTQKCRAYKQKIVDCQRNATDFTECR